MFKSKLYVYGDQNVDVPAHLNFGKYMLDQLRGMGDEIAIKNAESDEKITYKELKQHAMQVAVALNSLGVRKGDIVGLGSEPHVMFIPTALGIVFSGAAYAPFDCDIGKAHLRHLLDISKPKYFICTELFWSINKEVLLNSKISIKVIKMEEIMSSNDEVDFDLFEPIPVQGQVDTAIILYSSGTTGLPKAVEITHLNCIIYSSVNVWVKKEDSIKTIYVIGDFRGCYIASVTFNALVLGKTVVFTSEIGIEALLLPVFEKEKVNAAYLVPAYVNMLSKIELKRTYNLQALQYLCTSGDKIDNNTLKKVKERFPHIKQVLQGYGMSELHFISCMTKYKTDGSEIGSVGRVFPGMILKFVDENTRELLGPHQHGLICTKGPAIMKGYINVDPSTYLDEEGWFITGDLGYYDENKLIYIVGRFKDVIKYNGFSISPLELESILLLHSGVREVGVVGKPESAYGEEPTAFVVRQPGSNVTEQELIDFVAAEVPSYSQLRGGVRFVAELPKTKTRKVLRRALRDML